MKRKYLFFENYTYFNVQQNIAFFKNTLSNYYFITRKKIDIHILKQLLFSDNGNVEITDYEFQLKDLITKIKDSFSGDIISIEKSFQLNHSLSLEQRFKIDDNKDLIANLREITLFINNKCDYKCDICSTAHKQINYHCTTNNPEGYLSLDSIRNIIAKVSQINNIRINLCGGNIFLHPEFSDIVNFLFTNKLNVTYHIHIRNIVGLKKLLLLNKMSKISIILDIHTNINSLIDKSYITYIYTLVNKYEIEFIDKIKNKLKNAKFTVIPIFYGNISFFKKSFQIDVNRIINKKINFKEIIFNHNYNYNFLSKLFILPNGDVKINQNYLPITNISNKFFMKKAIHSALSSPDSAWKIVRHNFSQCKNCIFHDICPPISNYEIIINKNLCNYKLIINNLIKNC